MEPTLFSRIITGDIPCHKVYEDDRTFAFLDIMPAAPGHVLVIPKSQVEFVWDLATADHQALMETVQKVGRRIREVLGPPYVGQLVMGTDVPHAHVHVVPFNEPSQLKAALSGDRTRASDDELVEIAAKLSFS